MILIVELDKGKETVIQQQTIPFKALFTERVQEVVPPIFGAVDEEPKDSISLAYGFADPTLFPCDDLIKATADVLAEDADAALNYGPSSKGLIEQIVGQLRTQGVAAESKNILIGCGSSQILAIIPDILVDPGDTVIIEGPTFVGAVRQFIRAGARIETVLTDDKGLDVDKLEARLSSMRRQGIQPKFIYTIPTFHNPTGVTMSLERRKKLVALGAEYGVLIVEDDPYSYLRFEGSPIPSLAACDTEGWVIHVSTFSKIIAPGLRIGWAYAHPAIIARLLMFKREGSSGPFLTRVVARYCAEGRLEAHIQTLNKHYRHKRDIMLAAIEREFPADVIPMYPEGGFFVWCRLPSDMSATGLLALAKQKGALFLSGVDCFADDRGDDAMRLSFSFQPAEMIEQGIIRIGAAMRELRASL